MQMPEGRGPVQRLARRALIANGGRATRSQILEWTGRRGSFAALPGWNGFVGDLGEPPTLGCHLSAISHRRYPYPVARIQRHRTAQTGSSGHHPT
jgi:hypothetical protein